MRRFDLTASDLRATFVRASVLLSVNFGIVIVAGIVWRFVGVTEPPRTIGLMLGMLQVVFHASTVPFPTVQRMGLRGVVAFYGAASFVCPISLQMVFDGSFGLDLSIAHVLVYACAAVLTSLLAILCAVVIPRRTDTKLDHQSTSSSQEPE